MDTIGGRFNAFEQSEAVELRRAARRLTGLPSTAEGEDGTSEAEQQGGSTLLSLFQRWRHKRRVAQRLVDAVKLGDTNRVLDCLAEHAELLAKHCVPIDHDTVW